MIFIIILAVVVIILIALTGQKRKPARRVPHREESESYRPERDEIRADLGDDSDRNAGDEGGFEGGGGQFGGGGASGDWDDSSSNDRGEGSRD